MAEELQSLLEKINSEGVKKAEAERDAILAAAKIEADKIIAQRIFAHTIQCDRLIADSLTRLSKAQWEQRKQTRVDDSDAWEGVQTNNVMTNEIDAETIQADDVVAHRVYCVVCDCPVKRVDSQI